MADGSPSRGTLIRRLLRLTWNYRWGGLKIVSLQVLLLGLGLIALAVEVFVLPGFGLAGFLGLAAIATAIVLALVGAAPTGGDVAQAFAILGASLVITVAVVYAWLRHVPNSSRWGGLFL